MNDLDRVSQDELAYGVAEMNADKEWEEYCKSTYLKNYESNMLAEREPIPVIPKPIVKMTEEELLIGYAEYIEMKRFQDQDDV